MNAVTRTIGRVLFLLTIGCGVIGCESAPRMQAHDVTVALAEDVAAGSDTYTVDLVGVSSDETEMSRMRSMNVSDYWAKGDMRNTVAKKSFTFKAGSAGPQTLELKDPLWQAWEKNQVMNLYVIADLPEAASGSGDQDLRRLIIPLDSRHWDGTAQKITVRLRRGAMDYSPKPRPLPVKK
ncbi:MAG: hypothetical protein H7210_04865 [Pyrinomonadaceae bacterium]|nr:hypothetical protein [Phycisphaerales bacterium]